MTKIRVGLVGFGIAGQVFHEPFLADVAGIEIVKIYERREANIAEIQARGYDRAIVTQNLDDIFDVADIDLVVLGVPNDAHEPLTERGLKAGKHVVVEKPFTIDTLAADRLLALSKATGKYVFVHHNRRFDSDFKTVQQVIASGQLGKLMEYEAHFDRFRNYVKPGAWREVDAPGSGILYDLGAHLIDQALTLFGMPKRVFGDVRYQRPESQTVDQFEVILDYAPLKVTLKAGMLVQAPTPHFVVTGQQGQFVKYGMDVQEAVLKAGKFPSDSDDWGVEPSDMRGMLYTHGNHEQKIATEVGDYREFYQQVVAILNGAPNTLDAHQARDVIRIIELAQQSQQTARWQTYTDK